MSKILQSIKSVFFWAGELGWPVKLIAGAVVSAVTGGGLLTFLMENAAYWFALTYGFRPPVEGVPYVGAMVSIGSLIGLLIGVVLILTTKGLIHFWMKALDHTGSLKVDGRRKSGLVLIVRSLTPKGALTIIVPTAAAIAFLSDNVAVNYLKFDPIISILDGPDNLSARLSVSFIINFILLMILWRPAFAFIGATLIALIYYVIIGSQVLPPDQYAKLLRNTGFGGGIAVSIELKGEGGKPYVLHRYLLLRSKTSLTLYDAEQRQINEYPLNEVMRVSLFQGGFKSLSFRLPPKTTVDISI